MKILAIETSCDETAIAIVKADKISDNKNEYSVVAEVLHSQINEHREFGGVYPNVARREHAKHIAGLLEAVFNKAEFIDHEPDKLDSQAIDQARSFLDRDPALASDIVNIAERYQNSLQQIDAIAVTSGPGLAPALWIGVNVARSLSKLLDIPLIGVNHMAGHVLSGLFPNKEIDLPGLALLVSGGHTELITVNKLWGYEKIGKTLDDAAGEAFDKVARMLELPYPGGPEISKLATAHRTKFPSYEAIYNLPHPMQHTDGYNFSFSGLKTAAQRVINENNLDNEFISSFAREFEDKVIEILIFKTRKAITDKRPTTLMVGGGVIANNCLRSALEDLANQFNINLLLPPQKLTGDNAVMIAMAGYLKAIDKQFVQANDLGVVANWSL